MQDRIYKEDLIGEKENVFIPYWWLNTFSFLYPRLSEGNHICKESVAVLAQVCFAGSMHILITNV